MIVRDFAHHAPVRRVWPVRATGAQALSKISFLSVRESFGLPFALLGHFFVVF